MDNEASVNPSNNDHGNHRHYSHSGEWTFQEILVALRRGRWTIVICTMIALTAAGLYTMLSKPVYEATSAVLIGNKSKAGSFPVFDFTGSEQTTRITNELENLRSRSLATAVAESLREMQYVDAEKHQRILIVHKFENDRPPELSSTPDIVRRLSAAVDFAPVKESDVIKITVRSNDPTEAALIANTYTQAYSERDMNASRAKSRMVREFLQSQLSAKHQQLDNAETTLQSYMTRSGIVSLDGETQRVVNQLSQLEANRDGLEVEIATAQKTLASLRGELATQEPNVAKVIGESNDAYLTLLQSQIARLEVQRDLILSQYNSETSTQVGLTTDKIADLDRQISQLRKTLQARTETFVASVVPENRESSPAQASTGVLGQLKQRIIEQQINLDGLVAKKEALNNVVAEYDRQFNQIPQKSMDLARLQRTRLSSEKLYLLVEEKFNEAAITETSELGAVNIIDPANVPLEPVSPRRALNMALGLLLGMGAGVGLTLVRSSLDTKLRSPHDLKRLGVTPLGIIQRMDKKAVKDTFALANTGTGSMFDPHLVTYYNPLLSDAEGYRQLRTAIQDKIDRDPLGMIAITSAIPQEGKSTIAANLAVSFSLVDGGCLLIDADLRRPTIHQFFGLKRGPGLTNVLADLVDFRDVVHRKVIDNLDVLTAGDAVKIPAELLSKKTMKELVAHVRGLYRVILVDTPPILAVTDAGLLARLVDGVLVVVQSGGTTAEVLETAGERLKSQRHNFLGLVLNCFDVKSAYGSYRYGYRIGYGSYEYTKGGKVRKRGHHG